MNNNYLTERSFLLRTKGSLFLFESKAVNIMLGESHDYLL
jgi:hypothetical protein